MIFNEFKDARAALFFLSLFFLKDKNNDRGWVAYRCKQENKKENKINFMNHLEAR
jgi:hypothetical protein